MSASVTINVDRLPQSIRASMRCVLWRREQRDGRPTKVPYNPHSPERRADVTDSRTWGSFHAALDLVQAGRGDGVGIVLGEGLVGVDLDHCCDETTGEIEPWAFDIIRELASYAEASPSGRGVHVLVRGVLPLGGRRRGSVELYDSDRYFTVTGAHIAGTPTEVSERTDALSALHTRIFPPRRARLLGARQSVALGDAELLERAKAAANGRTFTALWSGDRSAYPSASEADLALVNLLAFWSGGDAGRMDHLFRLSSLYRPKWDERRGTQTYGARTIATAIRGCRETYTPPTEHLNGTPVWTPPTDAAAIPSPGVRVAAETNLFQTAADLAEEQPAEPEWIVPGFLAPTVITELDGKLKAGGKTTFTAHMVAAIRQGRPFLSRPTAYTPVVWLTEERPATFLETLKRADLTGADDLHILHWHKVKGRPWPEVVTLACDRAASVGARVLIVDTVGQFAGLRGDSENNSGDALAAVEPLQMAAASGLAVLVIRHERKGGGEVGESGRGSSAFSAAVDIVVSIRRGEGNTKATVRVLHALSRFTETPNTLVIDLTPDGYVALGTEGTVAVLEAERCILERLPDSPDHAMEMDSLRQGDSVIARTVAQVALKKLTEAGVITRIGTGKKGHPYRWFQTVKDAAATQIT